MITRLGCIASRVPAAQSPIGRLLRLPLRGVPRDAIVRVLTGPNRRLRWVAGSTVHGCWIGTYEAGKARLFADIVQPGMVVYDVGAHVGYYALTAARAVGSSGRVHAFEPHPGNLDFLQRHIRINALSNITVHAAAISDHTGRARLLQSGNRSMAHLVATGGTEVDAIRLDDVDAPSPSVIKIDVEGAEALVLSGATRTLTTARPIIFLATHGPAVRTLCLDLLRSVGYAWRTIGDEAEELLAYPADRQL